jgi:hypothetical protein
MSERLEARFFGVVCLAYPTAKTTVHLAAIQYDFLRMYGLNRRERHHQIPGVFHVDHKFGPSWLLCSRWTKFLQMRTPPLQRLKC